jgi:hypothetical protein
MIKHLKITIGLLQLSILLNVVLGTKLVDNNPDIKTIVRTGHSQILSSLKENSCFHLGLPEGDLKNEKITW